MLGHGRVRAVSFDYLKSLHRPASASICSRRCFPTTAPAEIEALIQQYRAIYLARPPPHACLSRAWPRRWPALGGRKGTATTKGTPTTRAVLEQFGLLQYFDHVQGTDGFPAKPAPDVIFTALAALGAQPGDCLLVGDSAADMEAGQRAGVKTCAVRYGYGKAEDSGAL